MLALQRIATALALFSLLACDEGVGDDDGDGAEPRSVQSPLPPPPLPLRSCNTTYVPPAISLQVDPVGLLDTATSDCAVGTLDSPCAPHFVYTPAVDEREPLFLFLPGTNMEPYWHAQVLMTAASTGYRTIGLSYDNSVSSEDACDTEPACAVNCEGLMREEVVRGINLSTNVAVARGDSIVHRLYRLLERLDADDPNGGWSAYYVPTGGGITTDNILWENIILAGFSQGAGHAAFISRTEQVHGLFLLDGANDTCVDTAGNEVAAVWMTTGMDASAGRPKYGVRHAHGSGSNTNEVSWQALGLGTALGSLDGSFLGSDVVDVVPPRVATRTAQGFPTNEPRCSRHMSMARDRCMPTDFAGATAANTPDEARLFEVYAQRMCYACDAATCP